MPFLSLSSIILFSSVVSPLLWAIKTYPIDIYLSVPSEQLIMMVASMLILGILLILKLCKVRHKKSAIEQISVREYEIQAKEYTQQQCAALMTSPQYMEAVIEKGEENEEEWNWQKKENRSMEELIQEQFYLQNVQAISHPEMKLQIHKGRLSF